MFPGEVELAWEWTGLSRIEVWGALSWTNGLDTVFIETYLYVFLPYRSQVVRQRGTTVTREVRTIREKATLPCHNRMWYDSTLTSLASCATRSSWSRVRQLRGWNRAPSSSNRASLGRVGRTSSNWRSNTKVSRGPGPQNPWNCLKFFFSFPSILLESCWLWLYANINVCD